MTRDERFGLGVLGAPVAAVLLAGLARLVGLDVAALVEPALSALVGPAVGLAAVAGGVGLAVARGRRPATRTVRVYTHGGHGTRHAAKHEAGHRKVARALGMRLGRSHIYRDGSGWTDVHVPADAPPAHDVAVSVAGRLASGSSAGCGGALFWADRYSDNWHVRRALDQVPADQRAAERGAGEQLARRALRGGVRAEADRLYRDGSV